MSNGLVFGRRSREALASCDTRIIRVLERALKEVPEELDFSVLQGHRGKQEQNAAYQRGDSKLKWPESNHNKYPSEAVDVVPYPVDWNDINRFYRVAAYIYQAAIKEGVPIRWGGLWKTFKDYPHWELI